MPEAASSPAVAPATSPRAVRGTEILSVASALPENAVPNSEIAERIGVTDDWIHSRTGIRERRVAGPHERLSDLAARAGERALQRAGVAASELDLVLVCTMTADELTPNAAPVVAHALGAERAGAADLGAACTGWLTGVALGAGQIETGRAERVLVVGADFITRLVDFDDKRTAGLFADATGAVVLGPTAAPGRIGPVILRSDGQYAGTIRVAHSDRKIRMDGHETFKHAVARMSEVTLTAAQASGLELEDIDLFVYHQANGRILSAVGERLKLPSERVVDCIEHLGNASSATIPIALDRALADGRLQDGMRVLLCAFGAGFIWGGAVVVWGQDG